MTARMYYDNDADPSALSGQTVAIIGYGSQGHAHALNLHESGVDVVVGLAPGSKSRAHAEEAGLRVVDVADAVRAADVIMIAVPDTGQKAVYDAEIGPNLRDGHLLLFAHGFNLRYGRIAPPPNVDVGMVAPKGPGHLVRSVYQAGGGVPALFAVEQDASGTGRARVLAYARALGNTRAGVLETTFKEETETDLFGEQSVLCGGTAVAGQDGLRDARRGRLPARAGVLRDDARAQAHRRPDVSRRPQLHALQRQRHGRVRRLRERPAAHRRERPRADARGPRRHPGRLVRRPLDRRERDRPPRVRAACARPIATTRSSRSGHGCVPRCRSSTRSRSRPARPRPRRRPRERRGERRRWRSRTRPAARAGGQRPHLRHDAARRGAGARRRPDRRGEARGRPPAGPAQGRRHRGRVPGRLAGRLRGGPPDRPGDATGHRRRGPRPLQATATRSGRSRRSRSPTSRTSTCSSRRATSTSSTSSASTASRRSPTPSAGSATAARSSAATPRSSSAPRTPRARTSTTCSRSTRRSSTPARPRSTSRTRSATPSRPSSACSSGASSTSSATGPRSASTATTTWGWPRPTRSRRSRPGRARSRSRSTASASAPATPPSRRSSWPCAPDRPSSPSSAHGVATEHITAASRLVSYLTGFAVQPNKAIVGGNAFAHESGIHQDGVIKNPLTYEIMTPQSVGLTGSQLTIGKLSGRRGLQGKLRELGHDLEGDALDTIYRQAIELADAKKEVTDADLLALVDQRASEVPASIALDRLERDLVARRQRHRHGDPDRRRAGALVGGDRQRTGQRPLPGGRRGPPADARLAPDPDRVRDQGRVGRRGRPGPGPGPLPALVGRGPRCARRQRPRVMHEHHRGVARGLPRGDQQAPRRGDQRHRGRRSSRRAPRRACHDGRDRRATFPRIASRRSPATASGRRSSRRRDGSSTPPAARFGFPSTGRSTSSAAPPSTRTGSPSGPRTSTACGEADAILLGAVGGPKWSDPSAPVRPEQALFALRGGLGLYANLRPVTVHPALVAVVAAAPGAPRRRRPAHRPRADRGRLLRGAAGAVRSRRRAPRPRHDAVHRARGRADRPARLRAGARSRAVGS